MSTDLLHDDDDSALSMPSAQSRPDLEVRHPVMGDDLSGITNHLVSPTTDCGPKPDEPHEFPAASLEQDKSQGFPPKTFGKPKDGPSVPQVQPEQQDDESTVSDEASLEPDSPKRNLPIIKQ